MKENCSVSNPIMKPAEQVIALGRRVRELRHASGLTLKALGEGADLALSTLSKIENGQMSPTYEVILKLARGLRVDVAQLFDEGVKSAPLGRRSVTRKGKGAKHETRQYVYEMLNADLARRRFITLVVRLKARAVEEFDRPLAHDGEEFIYVLSGSVQVYLEHYQPFELGVGDSCYFDSTMAHACVSLGETDASILWVCSDPVDVTAHR